MEVLKREWLGNFRGDLIAGLVTCMALIPEAIGFSIVAGVNPMVGVYGSFCIALIVSIFGGRPGMISGAAGATALVLASLVRSHGVEYMLAATVLTGFIQMLFGFLKIGNLMKFIPKPVMIGFVNALGIMMFTAQLGHFKGAPILIGLALLGVAVIYLLPKINDKIPAPIVSIAVLTTISIVFNMDLKVLGDMGDITTELPKFLLPNIPINLDTFMTILPYSLSVSIVGIVESLLTAQLVDDLTDTSSNKNRECLGQGLGNIGVGLFGGIAGCGMIGQSILNHRYGGRGRLSTFTAGAAMLITIILLNKIVVRVPVVSFGAVMVVVAISTFNWGSIKKLSKTPKSDTLVMISTVLVVLFTHNLAYGVIVGIILSAISFAVKMSEIDIHKESGGKLYVVKGELFFASTTKFINSFDYTSGISSIDIDLSSVKLRDESAVEAIDRVVIKFHKNGTEVNLIGLSESCKALIDKIGVHDKPGGLNSTVNH
jgi:sulfate permease, SulP family